MNKSILLAYSLVALIGLIVPSASNAALIGSGKVLDLRIRGDNTGIAVRMENVSGETACATWIHPLGIKLDSEHGRAVYSVILAAVMSGKSITIWGYGYCENGDGYDVIREVSVQS